MREQRQQDRREPGSRRFADRCPAPSQQGPDGDAGCSQHEQRVAEPAVHREVLDRAAIVDHDIEIGHRPEHRSGKQGLAPLRLRHAGGGDAGAKGDLGERVHEGDRFVGVRSAAVGERRDRARGDSTGRTFGRSESPDAMGPPRRPRCLRRSPAALLAGSIDPRRSTARRDSAMRRAARPSRRRVASRTVTRSTALACLAGPWCVRVHQVRPRLDATPARSPRGTTGRGAYLSSSTIPMPRRFGDAGRAGFA